MCLNSKLVRSVGEMSSGHREVAFLSNPLKAVNDGAFHAGGALFTPHIQTVAEFRVSEVP